jgi:hypothetical protein
MSVDRETPVLAAESFHERLRQLRLKIDSLPEIQRPHLIDLAETIARQHRRLHNKIWQNQDVD